MVLGVCTENTAGRMTSHNNGHVTNPCLVYDMIMAYLSKTFCRMLNVPKDAEFGRERRPTGLALIDFILHD